MWWGAHVQIGGTPGTRAMQPAMNHKTLSASTTDGADEGVVEARAGRGLPQACDDEPTRDPADDDDDREDGPDHRQLIAAANVPGAGSRTT